MLPVTVAEARGSVMVRGADSRPAVNRSGGSAAEDAFRMTFEDQNLAKKAAEGNVEAFAQLVRGHSGLVYRLATRILGVAEAQDARPEGWARAGSVEAFGQRVRGHAGLVYRLATRILGVDEAQDASQEVWIRVWRNLPKFRGESAFSTWIYKITVNTCLSPRRKEQAREAREFGDEPPYLPAVANVENDPETAAPAGARREELCDG